MSYNINGIDVINSLGIYDITDTSAVNYNYAVGDTLFSTTSTVISFAYQYISLRMNANITYTLSSRSAGRSMVLALDRSTFTTDPATLYTPTFPSDIKWAGGTTPTWTSYRYWIITLICVDSTTVRGTAVGYQT